MTNRHQFVGFALNLPVLIPTLLLALCQASGQDDPEERTRHLWDTKLIELRPQGQTAKPPAPKPPPPKPAADTSKADTSKPAAAPSKSTAAPSKPATETPQPVPVSFSASPDTLGDALVGVTVWRLREPRPGDDKETAIPGATPGEQWIGERVEAEAPLVKGQRVRISIESARTGYLYVIDREQYADGTFGPADLVFPTLRTHGGDNRVTAGRVVEIPGWDDNPRYFTMDTSRPDQVSEVLTVLVTPKPIEGLTIRRDPRRLSPEQVQTWEKQWGARIKRLEARGQAGKPYTKAEKQAGTERTRRLTHDEPLPQTMYYCVAKPGEPMLINVPLRIVR